MKLRISLIGNVVLGIAVIALTFGLVSQSIGNYYYHKMVGCGCNGGSHPVEGRRFGASAASTGIHSDGPRLRRDCGSGQEIGRHAMSAQSPNNSMQRTGAN